MRRMSRDEVTWKLVITGAAVGAGIATYYALNAGWRKAQHKEPPENPAAPDVDWYQALAWTSFVSLIMGLARLLASRGVAAGWRRVTGRPSPL